ncbi:hypothetical protein JX266_014537, partial [Neoarthrinium moseri]
LKFDAVGLVDAAGVYPKMSQPMSLCLVGTELDLVEAGFMLPTTRRLRKIGEDNLVPVGTPGVGEDRVWRNIVGSEFGSQAVVACNVAL